MAWACACSLCIGTNPRRGNIVFVRKGDHKVALVSRSVDFCKLVWLVTWVVVFDREGCKVCGGEMATSFWN